MGGVCKPECWTMRTCKDAAVCSAMQFLVTEEDLGPKGIRIKGQTFIFHVIRLSC